MNAEWTWYAVILVLNTLACAGVAFLLARRQFAPGQLAMILLFIALSFWIFGYAMLLVSPTLEMKIFWLRVENIGIIPQSVFWFLFALQFSTQNRNTPAWLLLLVGALPAVCLTVILSGDWIYYYYPSISLLYSDGGGPLKLERSPLYWAMFAQVYLLEFAALILLLRRFIGFRNVYRRQMTLLLTAVFLPWAANIYFQVAPRLPNAISTPIDLTPLTFAVSAGLVSAAIFGLKLFDLIPIARSRVLEYIPQMVFVLDADDRVLDINETGQRWLAKPAGQVIGALAQDVFEEWSGVVNRFQDKTQSYNEEALIPGDSPRTLEVAVFPLYNRGKLEGRVFVAHDVTSRIKLEEELRQANEALKNRVAEVEALREKLEEQAIRDPLTGVYNRRYLLDSIDGQFAQAEKRFNVLSVVMLDLDRFAVLNEKYGLNCGDVVLQLLVKHILTDLRRGDLIARYAGEEFVVLLPGLSLESAYARVEKWRSGFGATLIEFEGSLLSATFSAGVACFPIHGGSGKELLQAAERALSQAKSGGRNRVVIYS